MSYPAQSQGLVRQELPPSPTLSAGNENLLSKLQDIRGRVVTLADSLFGSRPRDATDKPRAVPNSFASMQSEFQDLVNSIVSELDYISSRL